MEKFVTDVMSNYDKKDKFNSIAFLLVYKGSEGHDFLDNNSMIDNLGKIDERLVFMCLFRQLVGQVNNGGFSQYYHNGYASGDHNSFRYNNEEPNLDAYNELITLYKKFVPKNDKTVKLFNIIDEFGVGIEHEDCDCCFGLGEVEHKYACIECNGTGTIQDGEDCDSCGGTGKTRDFTFTNDWLDNQFYEVFDNDMKKFFGNLFEKWLLNWDANIDYEVIDNTNNPVVKKTVVKLTKTDGNAFSVLCKVKEALRNNHVGNDVINEFLQEATKYDYEHLLATCMKYCEKANITVA